MEKRYEEVLAEIEIAKITPKKMRDLYDSQVDLFEKKNADYGNSFEKSLDEHGLIAAIVRMEDKLNRLKALAHKPGQVSESIGDTLCDLSNYAAMTALWVDADD